MHCIATGLRPSFIIVCFCASLAFAGTSSAEPDLKIGPMVARRAALATGSSRVVITTTSAVATTAITNSAATNTGATTGLTNAAITTGDEADVAVAVRRAGGRLRRALPIIGGYVADVPNAALNALARLPSVAHVALDRRLTGTVERTGATIGATAIRDQYGYDGTGVGVAVIDSGITGWHDDLSGGGMRQRVVRFVDFVNAADAPYDDYGHGTHVAGIIAGNGADSSGARSGVAPNASLVVLKVLDDRGNGRMSDVIAALDFVVANASTLNVRVVNLSVAGGVYESYESDPLTLAARRAVDTGIVVVAAAGNYGRDSSGRLMYGGVTSPGNAPWVLTVGASSHMGTADRADDTIARFSSRGPTAVDRNAKPDVVAPGVGIESLSASGSTMYTTQADYLLDGTVPTTYRPYLSQSGTSMATPVVAGTVALMLQANPSLTPNEVKAILQFTAERRSEFDPLTEGAGFLNAKGAVELASYLASGGTMPYPSSAAWSNQIIWGNRLVSGGRIEATANAWRADVVWGSARTPDGEHVEFGSRCTVDECDRGDEWRPDHSRNVVWGSRCGGDDCDEPWAIGLFGTSDDDTVVWGTNDNGDTVVWGTSDGDTVVWGTSDGDTVVWGTSDDDTVVWGTNCSDPSCVPVMWEP